MLDYCEAFGAKVDNIANYIKSQEVEARNAKTEIDRLQSRQAAAENKAERLKGILRYFMETRGLRSVKGRLNTISLRKNSQDSLVVDSVDTDPAGVLSRFDHPSGSRIGGVAATSSGGAQSAARLTSDVNGFVRREADNAKLRAALASGVPVQGAELRRGQHVRLT